MSENSAMPDDEKRLFEELKKDPNFLKYRNIFLAVTVIGGVCMFGAVGLMLSNSLSLLDVITVIVVYVGALTFLSTRLSRIKTQTQERLKKRDASLLSE